MPDVNKNIYDSPSNSIMATQPKHYQNTNERMVTHIKHRVCVCMSIKIRASTSYRSRYL